MPKAEGGLGWGQNHRGPGGQESPSGVQGGASVGDLGTKSPEAEEFLK